MPDRIRVHFGRWEPPPIAPFFAAVLIGVSLLAAISRGLDYLTLTTSPPELIERTLSIHKWGFLFLVGAALVVVGVTAATHGRVLRILGFGLLACLYAGLSVGLIVPALDRDSLDGIRSGTGLIFPAVWHSTLCLLTILEDRRGER